MRSADGANLILGRHRYFWISILVWVLITSSHASIPCALIGTYLLWRSKVTEHSKLLMLGAGLA